MKVFASNRLEVLVQKLKEEMVCQSPLQRRFVVVPHERMHQELMLNFAQDPDMQIAAGVSILTWQEALAHIFPSIPSPLELALTLEQKIDVAPLRAYLEHGGPLRKSALAEKLALLFFHYLRLPEEELAPWIKQGGWQAVLWQELMNDTTFHPLPGEVFLFHPYHLAPFQLRALHEMKATVFLFSPCAMYWGDLKTARQQHFFLHHKGAKERQEWEEYLVQDNPMLANWGKVGQGLIRLFEDENLIESYESGKTQTLLATVQEEMVNLQVMEKTVDDSIQVHAASSQLREVEVVWEIIQTLPYEPKEILVLAPQMAAYAPMIEMVFRQRGGAYDFAIYSLEAKFQACADLLDVRRYRFSRESVEKLLSSPLFLKKFGFDQEEAETLKLWMSKASVRYDLTGDHPCTWEAGLKRLVEALVLPAQEGGLFLDFSEADLLERWIVVFQLLQETFQEITPSLQLTLKSWAGKIKSWIETFFAIDAGTDFFQQIEAIGRLEVSGLFPFSTLERVLAKMFEQKRATCQASHLQAVKFASLEPGALVAAPVIILMGMDEGSFPRTEPPSSLEELPIMRGSHEDHYLFLEALCHARSHLFITYPSVHPEDGKHQKASSAVEQLLSYTRLEVIHHAASLPSCISFEAPQPLEPLSPPPWEIGALRSLARHPLRFFLEKRVGLDFKWREEESEFTISPVQLARLRAKSLHQPLDLLLAEEEKKGKLPMGSFREAAIQEVKEELTDYLAALEKCGVSPQEIYTVELKTGCEAPIQLEERRWIYPALNFMGKEIQGTIEGLSPHGLLSHGDDTLADLVKVWPLYLIALQLFPSLPLLLTKKGKVCSKNVIDPKNALSRYLLYAEKSFNAPSPLFPSWARAIFTEGKIPRGQEEDPILAWAKERHLLPPDEEWVNHWRLYLQEMMHELF
jgi:exodeoxyribonuclease V gamma subunit